MRAARGRRVAFSIVELMVVIGIIGVLVALLIPMLSKARASGHTVACLANLRQMVTAFQLYASDNKGALPPPSDPTVSSESWESLLRKYLPAKEAYRCQADGGMFEKMGSSYDWRDTSDTTTTAAGKLLSQLRRYNAVLVLDALPDWHANGRINAAMLDGTAQTMRYNDCMRDLDAPLSP